MRRHILATALALVTTAAGCIGPSGADDADPTTADVPTSTGTARAQTPPDAVMPAPQTPAAPTDALRELLWQGHIRAGAFGEMPAHFDPIAGATQELWNMSFELDVAEAPQTLELELAWEARAGTFTIMAIVPATESAPGGFAEAAYSDVSPVCIRIPAEDLAAGTWSVMAHSETAVDADLTFTTRHRGGSVTVVDKDHAVTPAEMVAYFQGGGPDRIVETQPCEGA